MYKLCGISNMSVTKADIINRLAGQSGLSKTESSEIIQSLLEILKRTLASGEHIQISGFGKFCVKVKQARKGRNPQTGNPLQVKSRRVVTFQCSSVLRGKINDKDPHWHVYHLVDFSKMLPNSKYPVSDLCRFKIQVPIDR